MRASVAVLSVYYDFDRYDIKPQYRTAIEAHARHLNRRSDLIHRQQQ